MMKMMMLMDDGRWMTDDGEWMIDDDGDDDVPAPPHAILLCFGVCRCF